MFNQYLKRLLRAWSFALLLAGVPVQAASLGLVADDAGKQVTVFDSDTPAIVATIALPTVGRVGDCAIKQDQTEGYVCDSVGAIWVVDLTTSPPRLSGGNNPIWLPIHPQELALSNDQKYLLAAGSNLPEPIKVVELSTRSIKSSFSTGSDCNGLDLAADGTVLVASARSNLVRRLALSDTGVLTSSGVQRAAKEPMNPYLSRNGKFGVVVTFRPGTITSFSTSNFSTIHSRGFTGSADGICAAIAPDGTRCYVRTSQGVDAFSFSSSTGALGTRPLFHLPLPYPGSITFYGMDQLALSQDGTRLFVGMAGAVRVYDTGSTALIGTLSSPGALIVPTGICVRGNLAPVATLPAPVSVLPGNPVSLSASLFDADGDSISVAWSVDRSAPLQLDTVPRSGPPTLGTSLFTQSYSSGTHTVQVTLNDGKGDPVTFTTSVTVQAVLTITGTVFADTNNNRRKDAREAPLSNWRIYADLNHNRKWDAGEPSVLSGGDGTYRLPVTLSRTYYIREVPQTGWKQTAPAAGFYRVVARRGFSPICNFGNRPIAGR